jgi:prepilin-type N-terminal cleavage/methylation domain-containing protein
MTSHCHGPRRGFTLIELLVVVFILGILFGLGVFFYPTYSSKQKLTAATNVVTGVLIRAKQQAKRDGLPTGLRLIPTGTNSVELQLIQQPDALAVGRVFQVTNNNNNTATVSISANLLPAGVEPLIAVSDYLDINGGGRLLQVLAVSSNGTNTILTVDAPSAVIPASESFSATGAAGTNYRIFPQARPMTGEGGIAMPSSTQVNLSKSQIVPRGGYYDILFGPGGGLVNQSPGLGQVLLFIEDSDPTATGDGALIVATQYRSGLIGVFPAGPAAAPYQYVTPERSSGM